MYTSSDYVFQIKSSQHDSSHLKSAMPWSKLLWRWTSIIILFFGGGGGGLIMHNAGARTSKMLNFGRCSETQD